MNNKIEFNPIETWLRHGLSDMFIGSINQDHSVYSYGTFFYIMAAEKHLKAILIFENKIEYECLISFKDKMNAVNCIARRYSHNFQKMIEHVSIIYSRQMHSNFIPDKHHGFSSDNIITALSEGYMETRYPMPDSTSRNFPYPKSEGHYYDPLGSSFFIDFMENLCVQCWKFLSANEINSSQVFAKIDDRFSEHQDYDSFKNGFLKKLSIEIDRAKK